MSSSRISTPPKQHDVTRGVGTSMRTSTAPEAGSWHVTAPPSQCAIQMLSFAAVTVEGGAGVINVMHEVVISQVVVVVYDCDRVRVGG